MQLQLDPEQPLLIALAGPNGAGKSTFFEAHFRSLGLRFVNADVIATELGIGAYEAAEAAEHLRQGMVARKESFIFETVFSDPGGTKVEFLREAAAAGYYVLLCFIGVESATVSRERVAIRVIQGGHGVPKEKLLARYPRTLQNLVRASRSLPHVLVYDNSRSTHRYRFIAEYRKGKRLRLERGMPTWFEALMEEMPK